MDILAGNSLARRIVLSVALGLGLILAIFGLVSFWTLDQMTQAAHRERVVLAATIAGHADDVLRYSFNEVGRTATSLTLDASDGLTPDQTEGLSRLQQRLGAFATLALVRADGQVLWSGPPDVGGSGLTTVGFSRASLVAERGVLGIAESPPTGNDARPRASLAAPVEDRAGHIVAVLVAELDPRHPALSLVPSSELQEKAVIALVDSAGLIVAGAGASPGPAYNPHQSLLGQFMRAGTPGVLVHEPANAGDFAPHLVAYAPVPSLPAWGVVVEQPEDIWLAVPQELQRRWLFSGVLALLAAVAVSWLDARRITRPLKELTAVAERFAQGYLDRGVRLNRSDEVGILAGALETMRQQLRDLLARIQAQNLELEERVALRTREAEARNRQLAAVNAIATTVSGSLRTEEILLRAAERLRDVTAFECASFRLDGSQAPTTPDGRRDGTGLPAVGRLCSESCLCGRAARIGVPMVAGNVWQEREAKVCQASGLRSVVAVPLCAREEVLGVMLLGSAVEQSVEQTDIDNISAIGRQIGMALANARLYEEVQERERARVRLIEQIISAQEGERRRIARDLHDSVGQSLSAIIMGLDAMAEAEDADGARATQRVGRAKKLAEEALADLRAMVFDLRPFVLDDLGLVPAIRDYAERQLGERGIRVNFRAYGLKDRLPPRLETCLFRVLQEAITNTARHAHAKNVHIHLSRVNGRIRAVVADDGVGFDLRTVEQPRHSGEGLGLLGMRERIEMLGGSVSIESSPSYGTRINVELAVADVEGEAP